MNKNGSERCISITQLEQDVDIIEKIKNCMKSNHTLSSTIQANGKTKYRLAIYNYKLSEDLIHLGCMPNKSLTLKFPAKELIPKDLLRHFIRGYFDGDGCIWEGKPKITECKNKKGELVKRFVHNMKFTFTGCYSFINALQDKIIEDLEFRKTKLNFSKAKNPNNNTSDKVCTMEYSGKKQIEKFYNYLYKDATIYGNRKHQKFVNIICADSKKLLSETWLNAGTPETVISSEASNAEERSSTILEMGVESSDSKCQALNDTKVGEDEDIVSSVVK